MDAIGWNWRKIDENNKTWWLSINMDEKVWKAMKRHKNGWKWMNRYTNGWKSMKMHEKPKLKILTKNPYENFFYSHKT